MAFSICCLINSFISKADDTFFQSASQSINQQQSMINLSSNTAFSSSTYNDFFTPHNIIQTYHQPPPIETCPHTCPITNQCTYNQGSNLGLSYSFDIWVAVIFDTYQQFHVPTPYPQPTTTCGDHWYTVCEPPKPLVCSTNIIYCPGTKTVMPRDLTTCRWQTEKCQNDPVVCTTEVRYCPGTQTVMPRDLTTCRWQTEKCQNDPRICVCPVGMPNCGSLGSWNESYTLKCQNGLTAKCFQTHCGGKPESYL